MKRLVFAIVALLVVVAAVAGFLVAKGSKQSSNTSPTPPPVTSPSPKATTSASPMSSASPMANQPAQATNAVMISNFAFSPATITVKKGTVVTWTNQDSVGHTVTETDALTGPNSTLLAQGKAYSFTYDAVGSFHYHCSVHPDMTGTVLVTN